MIAAILSLSLCLNSLTPLIIVFPSAKEAAIQRMGISSIMLGDLGLGVFGEGHSPSKSRFSKIETMSIEFRPLTSAQKYLSIFYKKKGKNIPFYPY